MEIDFPEEPGAPAPDVRFDPAILDHTPLVFGKFKGKTPEWVATYGEKGESWLCWAYENVSNFCVCSAALYRECGGKGSRAKDAKELRAGFKMQVQSGPQHELPGTADRYDSRASSKPRPEHKPFDDIDDDVPL